MAGTIQRQAKEPLERDEQNETECSLCFSELNQAPPCAAVVNHKKYSLPYKDLIFEVQIAYPSLSINLYQEPKVVGMIMLILGGIYL